MNRPLMNAVCVWETILWATGESLDTYAFATNLKITLIKAIGQYCLTESAPTTFGIRDRIPKFNLATSTVLNKS
jgi:hypothetical protein